MRVFEFGCGGSTLFFADLGASVTSVEHDPEWAALVREISRRHSNPPTILEIAPRSLSGRPEIGSTRHVSPFADFRAYVEAIEPFPDGTFDLVCIDGRARVACALASRSKVRSGKLLVLDNSERPDYKPARDALDDWPVEHLFGLGRKNFGPWETSIWTKP